MHYNMASLQRKLTSSSVSQPLRAARAAIQTHRKNQVGQAVARENIDNISFQALIPITQSTRAAQDRITNCCNNFSDSGSSGVELIGLLSCRWFQSLGTAEEQTVKFICAWC
jgi:hypothetical protein